MSSDGGNREDLSRWMVSSRRLTCTSIHGIISLLVFLILLSPARAQSNIESPPEAYQYKLNSSMAIIIVILIAALFFMVMFSVYLRHCTSAHSTTIARPLGRPVSGRSRRAHRGLEPAVIETFPTMVYSAVKELQIGKSSLECAVCLSEFEDHETLRLIPKCDHVFHPDCIDTWLGSHTTCPVCRTNLVPETDESLNQQLSELIGESDLEAQNDAVDSNAGSSQIDQQPAPMVDVPEVVDMRKTLNRNRTRVGSRSSSRLSWFFPRSHSTGHSIVQPGEDTERFTLRLPAEVRKEIINRKLNRATSMVVLPRESSTRRGYRTGFGGSRRVNSYKQLEPLDEPAIKSDRWISNVTSQFLTKMSSFNMSKGESSSRPELSLGESSRPHV